MCVAFLTKTQSKFKILHFMLLQQNGYECNMHTLTPRWVSISGPRGQFLDMSMPP
jgi:hypothetical protein